MRNMRINLIINDLFFIKPELNLMLRKLRKKTTFFQKYSLPKKGKCQSAASLALHFSHHGKSLKSIKNFRNFRNPPFPFKLG